MKMLNNIGRRTDPGEIRNLTVADAAEFLQIGESTLYALAREGRIPHFYIGPMIHFRREELAEYARGVCL